MLTVIIHLVFLRPQGVQIQFVVLGKFMVCFGQICSEKQTINFSWLANMNSNGLEIHCSASIYSLKDNWSDHILIVSGFCRWAVWGCEEWLCWRWISHVHWYRASHHGSRRGHIIEVAKLSLQLTIHHKPECKCLKTRYNHWKKEHLHALGESLIALQSSFVIMNGHIRIQR